MKKSIFACSLALLLLLGCGSAAMAEGIIVSGDGQSGSVISGDPLSPALPQQTGAPINLGTTSAGSSLDLLLTASQDAMATAEVTFGQLPSGCYVESVLSGNSTLHYLRGTPSAAGSFSFTLTVKQGDFVLQTLTYSLSVMAAAPTVSGPDSARIFVGDSATLTVYASAADGGALSYQWYMNSYAGNQGGSQILGANSSSYQVNGEMPGTEYYYCVVTSSNNGVTGSTASQAATVTISEPTINALSVSSWPAKTNYQVGDTLDVTGLQLLAQWSNGINETVTNPADFTVSPTQLATAGTQTVTVSYRGAVTTFTVNVAQAQEVVQSIYLLTSPNRTSYTVGDTVDVTGMRLQVVSNLGIREISSGFNWAPQVLRSEGTQNITVSYQGQTTQFQVTVQPVQKVIESISISRRPTKLSYTVGDSFDPTGMVLQVRYTDRSIDEISGSSNGVTCVPTRLNQPGTQSITVSYQGFSTVLTLQVNQAAVAPTPSTPLSTATPTATPIPTRSPVVDTTSSHSNRSPLTLVVFLAAAIGLVALIAYLYVSRQNREAQQRAERAKLRAAKKAEPEIEPLDDEDEEEPVDEGDAETRDYFAGLFDEDETPAAEPPAEPPVEPVGPIGRHEKPSAQNTQNLKIFTDEEEDK